MRNRNKRGGKRRKQHKIDLNKSAREGGRKKGKARGSA